MLSAQPPTEELAGRVALVTGAARGQGRAIARRLADAGALVVGGDLLEDLLEGLLDELGERGIVGRLEVTDVGSWEALVARAVEVFGRLDILCNNAGVTHRKSLGEETEEGFTASWKVNCLGPFLGMKTALPHLRRSENAAIVNTVSTSALMPFSMHGAYVSAKSALRGLTKVAALELGADGIRVNAVFPGGIATPMTIRDNDPGVRERFSNLPVPRMGEPEDIAETVLFLASDRSAYVTGGEFVVDGGQTAGVFFRGAGDE